MFSPTPLALDDLRFLKKLTSQGQREGQIISFSQKIALTDPLGVLENIVQDYPLYFYWENPRRQETILSYGITASLTVDGANRFNKAQEFFDFCSRNIIKITNRIKAEPRIFCSFTFFDKCDSFASPFPAATLFLPQFQLIKRHQETILTTNFLLDSSLDINNFLSYTPPLNLHSKIRERQPKKRIFREAQFYPSYNFKNAVSSALKSIESQDFSKIVLAHALDVVSPDRFEVISCLENLRDRYPDCQIFALGNSQGYHFLGASPERLINIENQQLLTDALAGSAPRGKNTAEDVFLGSKLLGNEKERREHQAVSTFISQRLTQLGLKPQHSPLKLLKLSNIQHLWTPIYAQLPKDINPLEIVAQLHPTPAVAGVPIDVACEQIRHYETFDRCLYAAPLGWIDFQGSSEFIVGIRSALIKDNQARLYAGAGIVAGSDPDRELMEIQLKFQAMLRALF
jgi:menaquinone-specific isochorismate synthase